MSSGSKPALELKFQAVFCMDEREESTRRLLEEIEPFCETYGCPGFFGIAMEYQGIDDLKPRALCPVVIKPQHLIREVVIDPTAAEIYFEKRRKIGYLLNALLQGKFKVLTSTAWTLLLAGVHASTLLLESFYPKAAHKLHDCFTS